LKDEPLRSLHGSILRLSCHHASLVSYLLSNANPDPGWKGRVITHPLEERPMPCVSRVPELCVC
jgi:hypothetical protein